MKSRRLTIAGMLLVVGPALLAHAAPSKEVKESFKTAIQHRDAGQWDKAFEAILQVIQSSKDPRDAPLIHVDEYMRIAIEYYSLQESKLQKAGNEMRWADYHKECAAAKAPFEKLATKLAQPVPPQLQAMCETRISALVHQYYDGALDLMIEGNLKGAYIRLWCCNELQPGFEDVTARMEECRLSLGPTGVAEAMAYIEAKQRPKPTDTASPKPTSRYVVASNGVIWDTQTNLDWLEGPDVDTSFTKASLWVYGEKAEDGWRMPTRKELETLCEAPQSTENRPWNHNRNPCFKSSGSWVWAERRNDSSAFGYDFDNRRPYRLFDNLSQNNRVFAVRTHRDPNAGTYSP